MMDKNITEMIYETLRKGCHFRLNDMPQDNPDYTFEGELVYRGQSEGALHWEGEQIPLFMSLAYRIPVDRLTPTNRWAIHCFEVFWERDGRWKFVVENRDDGDLEWIYSSGEQING